MPDAIWRKSNGCIFCNLFNGDMFIDMVEEVLFNGELTGVVVVIGVQVKPVWGNLTKFKDDCLDGSGCGSAGGCCGDNGSGIVPTCDCGAKRDEYFALM